MVRRHFESNGRGKVEGSDIPLMGLKSGMLEDKEMLI